MAGTVPLYRFVNSTTGHHYYSTASDPPAGFTSDITLGYLHNAGGSGLTALYRHHNATTGDYLLTTFSTPPSGYVFQATLGYLHTTGGPSGAYQDLTYNYDNNGNITAITDGFWSGSREFVYDDLSRLTQATGNFGPNMSEITQNYVYNAIGNILDKAGVLYTYGDPNHPSAVTATSNGNNYTYDANGNMLTGAGRSFTWNVDNRVDVVSGQGGTAYMGYDYTGVRVKKDAPGGITYFPFSGYEIEPSGVITKYIKIGIETFASKKGQEKFFYHNDHLGGVNVISDIFGTLVQLNEYDPWGQVSRSEGNIEPTRRFNGKELDPESGLYYYGGRYYDPELTRFISADPFVPRPGNPQSLNRYSYTINNPVNYIDPTGYFFDKIFKAIGKFFKSIFTKPHVFITTLAVGIATYGAGLAAAPAFGLAAGSVGAAAFAGAVGGTFAGMTGAALNGGNIWQGAIIGLVGGAVGGGVGGLVGGGAVTPGSVLAGGFAGGAAAGGMGTAFYKGNFFENAFIGGITSGILASVQTVALRGWQATRDWTDKSSLEGTLEPKYNSRGELLTDGTRYCQGCSPGNQNWFTKLGLGDQGGQHSYSSDSFLGRFINQVSKVHDWVSGWGYTRGDFVAEGQLYNTAFQAYSLVTMVPAAMYTGFSFHGTSYYFPPVRERNLE